MIGQPLTTNRASSTVASMVLGSMYDAVASTYTEELESYVST